MNEDNDEPSLSDVLNTAIDAALAGVRTNLPGEVQSYDADKHTATVKIMIPDPFLDEVGGRRPQAIAILPDVPVAHVGFGSIRIKIPVKAGAQCWLSFSSSCLTGYKASGGKFVDPKDDRRHHEADVIVLPFSSVGLSEDLAMIEFTEDGLVKIGGSNALVTKDEFNNHTHTVATTGTAAAQTGTAAIPTPITGTARLRG